MERKITDGAERKELHRIVLFVLAFVVTIVCIGTGSIQQRETVQVGSVATKRYVAPEDTVDEAATEKLREAAANSVGPIYKTDTTVMDKNVTMVEGVFQELDTVLAGLPEGESFYNAVQEISLELPVVLSNRQLMAYENLTADQRKAFANDCVSVLKQIYDKGVTADGLTEAKASGLTYLQELAWSSDLKTMAGVILSAAVEPNLIVDEAAVEAAKEEKRAEVDEVLIRKNQKIVDEGEIITQEIYDKLVALNLVSETGLEGSLMPMLGSLVITGMLFAALYLLAAWYVRGRRAPAMGREV